LSSASAENPAIRSTWQTFLAQSKLVCTAKIDNVDLPPELAALPWVDFQFGYQAGLNGLKFDLLNVPPPTPDRPASDGPAAAVETPPSAAVSHQALILTALAIVLLAVGLIIVFLLLTAR
jgi:hypothetical protein